MNENRNAIFKYLMERKLYPPTVREICEEVDLSLAAVHFHLGKLEREGFIEREPGRPRAIKVMPMKKSEKMLSKFKEIRLYKDGEWGENIIEDIKGVVSND